MLQTKQNKTIYPSEVHPTGKLSKKPQETFPQTLMNYEIIRDKVQTQLQSKPTPKQTDSKKPGGKKKLLNF